jgi:hypothetical protein
MEPSVTTELLSRLVVSVVLAAVTGLAVALCARLAAPPDRGIANYVVPHHYDRPTDGRVLTGTIHDPRAPRR